LSASLLAVEDPEKYPEQSILAIKAGVDMIHFDVIGSRGKKTLVVEAGSVDTSSTLTPKALRDIKATAQREGLVIPVDIHIMDVEPSEKRIREFIDAGADIIALHWEAFSNKGILRQRLQFIKERGVRSGIAIRPDVNMEAIGEFLKDNLGLVDLVSQSGVYPCLGGQTFIYDLLKNIQYLNNLRQKYNLGYQIMVDGGIEPEVSARKAVWAGADVLVAGSAFFGSGLRDIDTLKVAAKTLKDTSSLEELDIYDAVARRIRDIRASKQGKVWVLIEGYHGRGKTYTTEQIKERLLRLGLEPVIIEKCYRSNEVGDTGGKQIFSVTDNSIILVEGVYASAVDKADWDLRIYIMADEEYVKQYHPVENAHIVIDVGNVDEIEISSRRILTFKPSQVLKTSINEN